MAKSRKIWRKNGKNAGKKRFPINNRQGNKFHMESLEPRLLLSADLSFAMNGSANDLRLILDSSGGANRLVLINNSDQSVLQSQLLEDTSGIIIHGSEFSDRLSVCIDPEGSIGEIPIRFEDVVSGDSDRLEIIGSDRTWNITGDDTGHSGQIEFSGIENLIGAGDNRDTFAFYGAGHISGTIDGGAGGSDTLVIEGGSYTNVIFTPTGPDAGTVEIDGSMITYMGLEPVLLNAGSVTDVVFNLTDLDDVVVIEASGSGLQIRSISPTPTFETTGLDIPTGSLTINGADGKDSITIADDLLLPGADLILNAETIQVNSGVLVSTRQVDVLGNSIGDSGDIKFTGGIITVNDGAQLLAVDDRVSPPIVLASQAPAVKWTPGTTYSGVKQAATTGSGTGMKVDISVDQDGNPDIQVKIVGYDYAVDDEITFNDPDGKGSPITVRVSSIKSGNIILRANAEVDLHAKNPLDPEAFMRENGLSKIELLGATLMGGTVSLIATTSSSNITDGDETPFEKALENTGILDLSFLAGWSVSTASAEVRVGGDTTIIADDDVILRAEADSTSEIKTLGLLLSATYVESEAKSKAYVEAGAKIDAADILSLQATTKNTVEATAWPAMGLLQFAMTDTTSGADAYIQNGAVILASSLEVAADITNNIQTVAEPMELAGNSEGAAVVVANLNSTANAYVDTGMDIPGDILIAVTTSTQNSVKASAEPKSAISGAVDVFGKIKDYFAKNGKQPDSKTQASDEKPSAFEVSAAVAIAEASNTANAYIGSNSAIRSGGNVRVTSDITDDFRVLATSEAEDASVPISAAVAVGTTTNKANAYIADGAEVSASKLMEIAASTLIPNPADFSSVAPSDFWEGLQLAFSAEDLIQNAVTSYLRSAANAGEDGGALALSGSVNILTFDNTAYAYIGNGAKINQDVTTYAPAEDQTVRVDASNDVKTINLVGVFSFNLDPISLIDDPTGIYDFIGSSGKSSLGGSYNQVNYKTATEAVIEEGAEVYAQKDVIVEATSNQFNFLMSVAGGQAEKFGVSGAVGYAQQDSLTLAQVASGALITGGGLSVTAKDDTRQIDVIGGVVLSKQIGVDGSVGINEINRETYAVIGNRPDAPGGPWDITFKNAGDRAQVTATGNPDFTGTLESATVFDGAPGDREIQKISQDATAGAFTLSFGGETTGPLAYNATVDEIEEALNKLQSIQNAGGVRVTAAPTGDPSSDVVNVEGNIALNATATGNAYVFSLAASVVTQGSEGEDPGNQVPEGQPPEEPPSTVETDDPLDGETLPRLFGDAEGAATEDDQGNPTQSKGQGKTGIGIAGDVSINTIKDSAVASINGLGKFTSWDLGLKTINNTNIISAAGAAAVTTTDGLSAGIAGSFSKIVLEGQTLAFITGAEIDANDLTLDAHRTGDIFSLTAGVGVTPRKKGIAVAGSVSLNKIENDTEAWIDRGAVEVTTGNKLDGNVLLKAYDDSEMLAIAGSVSYGGKAGVGAGVGLNKIYNATKATISGSTILHKGTLTLSGINDNEIISVVAGVGLSGDTLGASGMVSLNFIENTAEASIENSTNWVDAQPLGGAVSLTAKDDSLIKSLAGSVGVAKTAGIGGALAYNSIKNSIAVFVDDSVLKSAAQIDLLAESLETVKTISAGGAGAEKFSLAGAVSINYLDSAIGAHVTNASDLDAAGSISIAAKDASNISALAGSVAGAGKATLGASVGYNDISNEVTANISGSDAESSDGNILVQASEDASVTSIAAGGAGAGKVALGGSVTINDIDNTTKAYIDGNAAVKADGSVLVSADDSLDMILVAGVLGGAGTAAFGVSNTTVVTNNIVESYIDDSQVTALGKQAGIEVAAAEKDENGNRVKETLSGIAVTATSWEDIQSFAVAGQGAGTGSVAGSATVNVLVENTKAYIGEGAAINEENSEAGADQSISVVAYDDTTLLSVAGALSGAGTAAAGAGADVGDILKDTKAYIWADTANARGDVKVQANSTEDILSISASLGGAGTFSIAGSAGVYVMNNTTQAFIGDNPYDQINLAGSTTTVVAEGSVLVSAVDDSELDIIAGNISGAGTAGVGVAAAVTVIDKTTEAFIGPNADVTGKGGGAGISAHTGVFSIDSIADSGSEDFGTVPSAEITQVNDAENTLAFSAAHGFDTGQAVIYAENGSDIPIEQDGSLEEGQTYYVIRIDDATIQLALTEEDAYDGVAINLAPAELSGIHSLSTGIPTAPNAEVTAPGQQLNIGAETDFDNDGVSDLNPDAETQSNQRTSVADSRIVNGVAVTAINKDDLETIAVSGGGAGTVAVNIGGSVNVISSDTFAYVSGGASVNKDTNANDEETSNQSVLIAAGNDLYAMEIGGAISIAGAAAVTPGADVTVVTNNTRAVIDDGALVKAEKDIDVQAHAVEDVFAIAAGIGGSGTVGIGVAASVLVMNNTTYAYIGNDAIGLGDGINADPTGANGAVVHAGGNILVSAEDTTKTFMIAGSLGVGLGAAGAAGAAGVTVINKDTQALVGSYATVDAKGNGGYLTGILDGGNTEDGFGTETEFRGLAVQANSGEDLFVIGASAGGGLYAGLAGGATVEIVDSNTKAYIGNNAVVNGETTKENDHQSVNVSAANKFSIFALGGGLGIGGAGIAGGVDVGILRNDVTAYIGDDAEIYALGDVDVNALSSKDIDSFGMSAGIGAAGISGSVSVWSIGAGLDSTYSYDEKDNEGNVSETQSETPLDQNDLKFILSSESDKNAGKEGNPIGAFASNLGSYSAADQNGEDDAPDNTQLLGTAMGKAGTLADSKASGSLIDDALTGENASGTSAYIGTGATVIAEDDVNVQAKDRVDFDVVVGSASLGGLALGGSVAVLNLNSNTQAFISAETYVNAGPDAGDSVLVHAGAEEDLYGLAIAGQLSAGLSLGAQVIVLNDNSSQTAFIGFPVEEEANSATIERAGGGVILEAVSERTAKAEPYGGGLSLGGSVGASVGIINGNGQTKAFIDDARIGQGGESVESLTVAAESDADIDVFTLAVSGGISFGIGGSIAIVNYGPSVEASIGSDADITVIRDVDLKSNLSVDIKTDANGASVGGLFGAGASVSYVALGKGDDVYEVEASLGEHTKINARALRITAGSTDTLLAESLAGSGGVVGIAGAQSDVVSDNATLVQIGDHVEVTTASLALSSIHGQNIDAKGDSYALGLAAGSGAGVDTVITGKANVDIGSHSTLVADTLIITALNRLEKNEFAGDSNLRSGSASSGNVSVLKSSTEIGTEENPFEASVSIGDETSLIVEGDSKNPGTFKIETLADIHAVDNVRIESVSGFGVSVGMSDIQTDSLAKINMFGSILENRSGDIYLTAKTNSDVNPGASLLVVTGLTGGAGAEATGITKASNQIDIVDSSIKGSDVYLFTGKNSLAVPNLLDAYADANITATSLLPSINVPVPKVEIYENNSITIDGESNLQAMEDVYLVAKEGLGGNERGTESGIVVSISMIPYGIDVADNPTVQSLNTVSILGEDVNIEAGTNNKSLIHVKPLYLVDPEEQLLDPARLGKELTAAEKAALFLEADLDYEYVALDVENINFSVSNGTVIEVVENANGGGAVNALYRFIPQTEEAESIVLEKEDYSNESRWEQLLPDYDLDLQPPSGTVQLEAGDIVRSGNALYVYKGNAEGNVDLQAEIYENYDRWGVLAGAIYRSDATNVLKSQIRDKFYVIKPVALNAPALTYVNMSNLLFEQRQKILSWMTSHDTNAEAISRYQAQLESLDALLAEMGLFVEGVDESTGETITAVRKDLDVLVLEMPDIYAVPGSIFIDADGMDPETFSPLVNNQLVARAGAEINILNQTPFTLSVNDAIIRDNVRVAIFQEEMIVLKPGNVYVNYTALTDTENSSAPREIRIVQEAYPPERYDPQPLSLDQDLYITGDVINESGDLFLKNMEGSINVVGEIRAQDVVIRAARDFNLSTEDWLHTNRDPRQYLDYYEQRDDVYNDDGNNDTEVFGNKSDVTDGTGKTLEDAINENESSILAQGRISISARYLNINGLIQSGVDTITLFIDNSFNPGNTTTTFVDDDGGVLAGIGFGEDNVPVDGYFDAEKQAIVVEEIVPQGGEIILSGQILSTGNGELKVAHGYTSINIVNESSYELILNRIDTTTERIGRIEITDTGRLLKTEYIVSGEQIIETNYEGTPFVGDPVDGIDNDGDGDVDDGAIPGINYAQTGDQPHYEMNEPILYTPQEGLRYLWTEGQDNTKTTVTKYEKRSFNLLGNNKLADLLAKDNSYVWRTIDYPDEPRPLLESEVLVLEGTEESPGYADGSAYSIEFERMTDESVYVTPGITLVKWLENNTVYRYSAAAARADLVLSDIDYANDPDWEATSINPSTFVEDPDLNQFDSDFINDSITADQWVTGGGWMRYRTVHLKITEIEGFKDYYTHTLAADYPIAISFIQGSATPQISVETEGDLYLQGNINSPATGSIQLKSTTGSITSAESVAIFGADLTLVAGDSIDLSVEGNSGQLKITAGHDIRIASVSQDNLSSSLLIDSIVTTGSDIVLIAPDGIEAANPEAVIRGDRIELYAKRGGIGSAEHPLLIDSDSDGTGGLAAKAEGDIHIVETDGDLKLVEPEAWGDVVASVYSSSGDIYLEARTGSILDAFYENFRPSAQSGLQDMYLVSPDLMAFLYPHTEFLGLMPTSTAEETPNVIGHQITLIARGIDSGVGRMSDTVSMDLSLGYAAITVEQKEILSQATPGDVLGVYYAMYEYMGSDATGVDLALQDFGEADLWQKIEIDVVTETDRSAAQMESVQTGQTVLMQYSAKEYGLYRYLGGTGTFDLALEDYGDAGRWQKISADYSTDEGLADLLTGNIVQSKYVIERLMVLLRDDVDVETATAVDLEAEGDVVLQTTGDFNLGLIQADGDVRLDAGGSILNGNPEGANIISTGVHLVAGQDIGAADDPICMDARYLESNSKSGSTWIANTGGITVGGFEGAQEGMSATGAIVLSSTGPITMTKNVTANDQIVLTSIDSLNPGEDLNVADGATVESTGSYVELRAGDGLTVEEGGAIRATGAVRIYGDYGNADPGVGSRIVIYGSVTGSSVEIFGNTDDDVLDAGGASVGVTLHGYEGNDEMHGSQYNDIMFGDAGDDFMYGNAGDDAMYGGLGNDTMDGGAGDDGMIGDNGILVREVLDGSTETVLTIQGNVLSATINAAGTVWRVTLEDAESGGNDVMAGGEGNDAIHGGFGDDVLYGDAGKDVLFGDLGNDTIDGGADSDHLYGGQGDDSLDGGAGTDIVYGGTGSDTLVADVAGDSLIDWFGPYNIFKQPGNGYGRPTVIVSPSPWVQQFLLNLAEADGATNPNDEIAIVIPGGMFHKENVGPGPSEEVVSTAAVMKRKWEIENFSM